MKVFKLFDRVEFHRGGLGTVIYVSDSNPKNPFCTVRWDDHGNKGNPYNTMQPNEGDSLSISLPAIDKSPEFNPVIKRARE